MSATSVVLRGIRKRPWTTSVIAGGTSLVGMAALIEARANLQERNDTTGLLSLPRAYDGGRIRDYWSARPISICQRLINISYELGPVAFWAIIDFGLRTVPSDQLPRLEAVHAARLREALTNLGPAFVKAGQQLSVRPDLAPPPVLLELSKLCDAVRPIDDEIALQLLRRELGLKRLEDVFSDIQLVASASLGQVYKAQLCQTGEFVAVKVQRPNMTQSFSRDLYLLHRIGQLVDMFTTSFTNQPPFHAALYDSFARGSYGELDYELEAKNQKFFQHELAKRKCSVLVPDVIENLSSRHVLTSQWIDGVKLADASKERIRELIPVGVELFLTQLLDIGKFHSDPHSGNLLVTSEGRLCLLDFGLCAEVDEQSRNAMTKAIVHLLLKDFDALVLHDSKELGFLPADFDPTELKPILTKILTVGVVESSSSMKIRKRKLLEISNELNEVFFHYPFSIPPYFALITRGLGLLEGIALTGDPEFDIFQASVPYARRRAVQLLRQNTSWRSLWPAPVGGK